MTATAALLASLEKITHETTTMLAALDHYASTLQQGDLRDAKGQVYEIRNRAQKLFDWLGEVRLEEPRN